MALELSDQTLSALQHHEAPLLLRPLLEALLLQFEAAPVAHHLLPHGVVNHRCLR